jgi:hypothetical protein
VKLIRNFSKCLTLYVCFSSCLAASVACNKQQGEQYQQTLPSTRIQVIRNLAKSYRDKGVRNPEPIRIEVDWSLVSGFDEIISGSDLICLATLIDQRVRPSANLGSLFETVSKFRIDELLLGQTKFKEVPFAKRVLPDMLMTPLNDNEIFVVQIGGTMEIDGVLLREDVSLYPSLAPHFQYILFLSQVHADAEHSSYYGSLQDRVYETYGPFGVVLLNRANKTINPLAATDGMTKEIADMHLSHTADFLNYINQRVKQK